MKIIKLEFDKSETRLAGFPYGEATYKKQVREEVEIFESEHEKIKIVFPIQIEKVASSFVQGFFSELINTIGYEKIEEIFVIESSNESLTRKIIANIY